MKNMKKILVLALAALLLVAVGVGGTLAWLTATSGPVENTFVKTKIEIELKENKLDVADGEYTLGTDETDKNNNYVLLPGQEQPKNPFVRIMKGSEKCYVFIEVLESANYTTFIASTVDDAKWKEVTGVTPKHTGAKVYVYTAGGNNPAVVNALDEEQKLSILTDNKIKVKDTVTQDDMTDAAVAALKIEFYGYAIQSENQAATETGATLWAKIAPTTP